MATATEEGSSTVIGKEKATLRNLRAVALCSLLQGQVILALQSIS